MSPKKPFASRTLWVNVLALIASMLGVALADEWVMQNANAVLILTMVLSVVNIVLRFLTERPVTLLTVAMLACLVGCGPTPAIVQAQTAVITAPTNVAPGDLVILDATQSDGADFEWLVLPDKTHLPVEGGRKVVFASGAPGRYTFVLAVAKGDAVAITKHELVVGVPPGPVPPGPTPPGPNPPQPTPPGPAPIPVAGLRVLVIEDSDNREKLPRDQQAVLTSDLIREYLESKCATGRKNQKEYRFWDEHVDAKLEDKHWQDALALPRTSLPWIIISTGSAGYAGPLPANVDQTLELLRKYGG